MISRAFVCLIYLCAYLAAAIFVIELIAVCCKRTRNRRFNRIVHHHRWPKEQHSSYFAPNRQWPTE